MKLVVTEVVDHCQGADIVTHALRVEGWSAYGPTREEAQRWADCINRYIEHMRPLEPHT